MFKLRVSEFQFYISCSILFLSTREQSQQHSTTDIKSVGLLLQDIHARVFCSQRDWRKPHRCLRHGIQGGPWLRRLRHDTSRSPLLATLSSSTELDSTWRRRAMMGRAQLSARCPAALPSVRRSEEQEETDVPTMLISQDCPDECGTFLAAALH